MYYIMCSYQAMYSELSSLYEYPILDSEDLVIEYLSKSKIEEVYKKLSSEGREFELSNIVSVSGVLCIDSRDGLLSYCGGTIKINEQRNEISINGNKIKFCLESSGILYINDIVLDLVNKYNSFGLGYNSAYAISEFSIKSIWGILDYICVELVLIAGCSSFILFDINSNFIAFCISIFDEENLCNRLVYCSSDSLLARLKILGIDIKPIERYKK